MNNSLTPAMSAKTTPDLHPVSLASQNTVSLDILSFWQRYEQGQLAADAQKKLIQELIFRLKDSEAELVKTKSELEARQSQILFQQLQVQDQTPYAVILLDGSSMLWNEVSLRGGATGAIQALRVLRESIQDFVHDELPNIPVGSVKVIGREYAVLKDVYQLENQIIDRDTFVSFVESLAVAHNDFDVINVHEERAVAPKIISAITYYVTDPRCQRILLGTSNNKQVALYLTQSTPSNGFADKLVLLEGLPYHPAYNALKLSRVEFGTIFRKTAPGLYNSNNARPSLLPEASPSQKSPGTLSAYPPPSPAPMIDVPVSAPTTWAAMAKAAAALPATRAPTPTLAFGKPKVTPTTLKVKPVRASTNSPAPTLSPSGILRDHLGQRLDPPAAHYNREEVNRVKKLKLCNVHFLRPLCTYGAEVCGHRHDYNPSKAELDTLKLVARMAPCVHGTRCKDAGCIYGHRCPAPVRGGPGKNCIFGTECRFTVEMHD